jgi:hypothetical protein
MKTRIVGLETEFALLHYPTDPNRQKTLTGTEIFELINAAMDEAGIVRLYEEKFYPETRGEPFSSFEDRRRYSMKKNRMFLSNGGRFYLDTGDHPEYASPECRSAFDLLAYDKAGERIIEDLSRRVEQRLNEDGTPGEILICKNNIDIRGNTYGCHENYLIPRRSTRHNESAFFKMVIRELIPFLITRQIFCGAGKVITGNKLGYQISQRADFIDSELSSDTTFRRGIINSRDEPLSKIDRFRRLHILVGDSNLSELATVLKVGTTMLVLRVIEEEGIGDAFAIEDPILALREISHDPTCRIKIKLLDGSYRSPIEIQRAYLDRVRRFLEREGGLEERENAFIIEHWKRVLDAIEKDPMGLRGDIDWIAKRWVTNRFLERHKVGYQDLNKWVYLIKRMKSLRLEESLFFHHRSNPDFDIQNFLRNRISQGDFIEIKSHVRYSEIDLNEYFRFHSIYHKLLKMDITFHDVRRDRGLFYRMRERGLVPDSGWDSLEEEIERARTEPPANTRAKIRSDFIKLLAGANIKGAVNWDSISVHDVKLRKVNLLNPFHSSNKTARELIKEIEVLARLGGK